MPYRLNEKRKQLLQEQFVHSGFKANSFSSYSYYLLLSNQNFQVDADTVTTAVTVGNSAPVITAGPAENPVSSTTSPTNVGLDVTWQATATDYNGDNYYLIICSSDSVTPVNSNPPTCGATTWCTSTATTSASQATCSRTTLVGDAYTNNWYAFVCDGTTAAACSATGNTGTGDSGSPFVVNHRPSFTAVSNDSPKNPGGTITWSTTASDTTDSHTVKLLVCKTTGITGDACDGGAGDTWCSSSLVASDPSCQYEIPAVAPAGSNNAYVYIVDQHNFAASSASQGSNVSFTISNVAPVVSAVTINGGVAINLEESTTKAVTLTATVTDNNSCQDLSSVLGYVYRSGIAYSGCDTSGEADNNYCYPEVSCSVSGASCTGSTDASADYTCTVNLQYYADPTDANTQYPTESWMDTIKATDSGTNTHATEVSTGVELNSLIGTDYGYTVTSSLNYGNLGAGQKNDPLDKIITTTPTGNVGLDQEHSGAANMCVDYPTCAVGTPIGVAYQKYALASSTAYSSGSALSTTPVEVELNVAKPTTGSPTTNGTFIYTSITDNVNINTVSFTLSQT